MRHSILRELTARNLPVGKHGDGQGLWLVKSDRACGKWVLRLFISGKRREMGLGRWPDVCIVEARARAADARKLSREQSDPIEARRRSRIVRKPLTIKEAIDGCFEARKAELKREGDAGRWMSPLTLHVIPKLGKEAIEALDQHAIKEVLNPVWHAKPEAAVKALNRLGLALKHAAALGLDVDIQATTKARALLGKQRHKTEHIPSLPYPDAPEFYRWLRNEEGVSALALRFLILTVARTSEVRLAAKAEIAGDVWTLPAERTKTATERRIPLVEDALAVIKKASARSQSEFLFPAYRGQPISDAAMAKLMRDRKYEARPHGFRATFRTWVEEQTNTPFEVKESALGHAVDQGVVAAYQRSDRLEKRRVLMQRWTDFLTGTVEAATPPDSPPDTDPDTAP